MAADEKARLFRGRLETSHPCDGKHFDASMVVASKQLFGRVKYMSYSDAIKKKGTAISKSGPEVRRDAMRACAHYIDGHRDTLLQAVVEQTRGRMNDVNFYSLICFRPKFGCEADVPELEEDGEEADGKEL